MDSATLKNRFSEFNLDPALAEMVEAAPAQQIIEGIVRLEDPDQVPSHFRVVSRFKRICTGRFAAADAWTIRRHPNVISLKAARPLGLHDEGGNPVPALDPRPPRRSSQLFTGRGSILAALDFGLDFAHPNFLNRDGTTRLVGFWHQGAPYDRAHPNRFGYGRFFSPEEINAALTTSDPYRALGYHPAISDTGSGSHGTHTMDIAAGNGRARGARPGAAPDADLIFVHLSTPRFGRHVVGDLGDSVRLLEGLDAVNGLARGRPWVVNLSVGRTAGSHDGTSPVEQGMQELLRLGSNRAICQSCGNYRSADLAVEGRLRDGEYRDLTWIIDPADTTANEIDAWYSGKDRFVIGIRPPKGSAFTEARLGEVSDIVRDGTLIGRIYHRKDDPNNSDNHVEVFLYPGAPPGVWTVRLSGDYVISGRFHAWIERDLGRPGAQSRFARAIASRSYTLGTIATSPLVITVGAYDANARGKPLAPFSSCGPTRDERHDKPELVAPGVGVVAARSIPRGANRQEGLLVARSGTSMAAPHVAGTVCAMFEAAGRPVSIDEIRDCLRRSAEPVADAGHGNCCAWGRLNAAAAIRSIRKLKEPTGGYAMEDFTGVDSAEDERAIADALARKDWPLALKLKIESGSRDENELTNLIFFAGHPELPQAKLDPKDPNFEKLSSEWSTIRDREVWKAIEASARNTDLVVAGDEVSDHHRRFFRGKSGKRLKTLVENAAREAGLNPGLLGTIMMAETRRPQSYLSSEKASSYHIGADDFFEGRAAIKARVPAYAKVKWDKKQKPMEHLNDAKKPRMIKTILFDSGPDAVLATAVYIKFREVRLRELAAELGGNFDSLPLAVQIALSRMAMGAGTDGATPFLKHALKGGDIFVRKAIPVVAYQTQRNATVRTAQAMHLSDWVFGIPVPAAVKPPAAEAFENQDETETGMRPWSGLKEESMEQEAEASVMDFTVDGFLDRAEQALRGSYGGRRQSETVFLGRLLGELDDDAAARGLSPAELLRTILSNRRSMQNANEVLQILATPSQRPEIALRKGDWMIRAVPGTGDIGHVAVLASDDLLAQPMLAPEGIAAESTQPGHYGLVIEAGAFPHSRARPYARRWLDDRGRVPPHTVVLRPRYADPDAMADFPEDEGNYESLATEWSPEYAAEHVTEMSEFSAADDRAELSLAAISMQDERPAEADETFGADEADEYSDGAAAQDAEAEWLAAPIPDEDWEESEREESEREESEYPNARIIPGSGEAAGDSEASEETWIAEQAGPAGPPALRVRILWPALGFPAVIAPRAPNARGSIAGDATHCISLLVLASRTLTRDDVARHLRCVTWDNRWQRHIPEGTFRAAEIAVRADVKSDPISLPTPKNRLISLVGFGGGKGEKSTIIGGIAKAVLEFYSEKLPKDERLPYLHEIRISEDASNRFADDQYHLFWNNAAQKQDAPSDEMRLLIDYHAHPLRERTVESYEQIGKYLLEEYEFEYGIMHQPYQQSYSQLTMRRPRAEVLHPLFVKRAQPEPLRIGHLTDLHVDVRADVYEANLEAAMKFVPKADYLTAFNKAWETLRLRLVAKKRSPAPWRIKADLEELANLSGLPRELVLSIAATQKLTKFWRKGSYNNLNRSFRDNYTKAKGESDILLLTGDLIDYGRGHYGVTERGRLGEDTAYHEDRNWFLFYWLLAGDKSYTVPSYTILGNHDWRVNPYPPLAIAGAPSVESILNNYEEILPEFQKWLLQIAHGPGHERAFSYVSTAVGALDLVDKEPQAALSTMGRLAANTGRLNLKGAPTETTVASVMWYLLTINPFLDYSFPHPSGQKLLMLDWAEAEDVLFDIVERGKARPYLPHEAARASDPGPQAGDCLTAAQQKMVANFVARPGVSKLVGIHAPPIAPWYDWFDSELVKSRKTFPDFSKEKNRRDCEALGGKWDEAGKKCTQRNDPRGPDIVSMLSGGKKKWNGHPFFAIRPPKAFDGMVANYGSLVKGRDEFIRQLIEPNHSVRAVFAGHNHRDGLHMLWRMGPQSGAQTNGTLRVRLVAAPLGSVRPGVIFGPLWVNTTSAGFRGHYRPRPGEHYYVPPGRALVSVRRDGTIEGAQFRRLPGIDKRAPVPAPTPVPVPVP